MTEQVQEETIIAQQVSDEELEIILQAKRAKRKILIWTIAVTVAVLVAVLFMVSYIRR